MPDMKADETRPARADSDLRKMQQRLVDETVDESFPASDPPAWTTAGSASVAAQAATGSRAVGQDPEAGWTERAASLGQHYAREAQRRLWPEAQRGAQALARPVETYPLAALMIAGAAGYALAWWIHRDRAGGRSLPAYGRRAPYGRPSVPMSAAERHRAEDHLARSSRAAGSASATADSF